MKFRGGALLIDKPEGISSFGVIESLQRAMIKRLGCKKRDLPSFGHGGTLDPFATGLLIVCFGDAVKLTRYFLDSNKEYSGVFRFGATTRPGDPTEDISESSTTLPPSLEALRAVAHEMTLTPYLQTPPMFSAKKVDGKTLYELARKGIEVEREAKAHQLSRFEILSYSDALASFEVKCTSGTYIRTLAQDFARKFDTLGMLTELRRTASGALSLRDSQTLEAITQDITQGMELQNLECFVAFDDLLKVESLGIAQVEINSDEAKSLIQGRQNVLPLISRRARSGPQRLAFFESGRLVAVAHTLGDGGPRSLWQIERVFP